MSTTNLFLSLPTDILGIILHDWIGQNSVKDFAALDIAMCNRHCRAVYNSIVIACPIVYKYWKWHCPRSKFQLFLGWLRLRGMQLAGLEMMNYPVNLLNWKMFSEVKNLALHFKEEEIDLNEILTNLPQLDSFTLSGEGPIIFSPELIPPLLKLQKLKLILTEISHSDFVILLKALGSSAKELTTIELSVEEESYDIFYYLLRYFPKITELKYTNGLSINNAGLSDLYDAIVNDAGFLTFPNIHKLHFQGEEEALVPVLSKCPNLMEFCFSVGSLSAEVVGILTESLPALKILRIPDTYIDLGTASLLSTLPANTLEMLELHAITDECLRLITTRQTMLKQLMLTAGEITSFQMGTLYFCQGTMKYLEELSVSKLDMSNEMYMALWTSSTTFPSLKTLSLKVMIDDGNELFIIFNSLLSSSLSAQLVTLNFSNGYLSSSSFKSDSFWAIGLNWLYIPTWASLEKVSLDWVPIYPLDEFFQRVPNLRALDLGEGWKQRFMKNPVCADFLRVLRKESFQHAHRLESFTCVLPDLITPTGEYQLWKGIIEACPTLRNLMITANYEGKSYWNTRDEKIEHVRLIQEFQRKISFFNNCIHY